MKKKTKYTHKVMSVDRITKRLIGSYPDDIVCDGDGNLDFEETVYNFAKSIFTKMPETQQLSVFEKRFENVDEIYDHLILYISPLRMELENFISEEE